MPIEITMPALSPTMEDGKLARWLVKEGDNVAPGDVIAEIETDKATMEVEAVEEGTVARIVVPAGSEAVRINTVIAILAAEGEDPGAVAAAPAAEKPAGAPAGKPGASAAPAAPAREEAPAAPPPAKAEAPARAETPAPSEARPAGERIFASPLARRLASEAGLELAAISGSGPKGRIVKADVERAVREGPVATAPAPSAPAAPDAGVKPASDRAVLDLFAEGSYELVPHDKMRKIIAQRLMVAKSTIPHFYLTIECDIDPLLALREELNRSAPVRDGKPAFKISVNDMIIKALALALRDVPEANVSWTEEAMVRHHHSDIGVAVAIPGGLITPIVRRAEEKSLSVIANEMKDMAGRARERRLKPEEYQGGSSAVSNLGMMGVREMAAVINPPHATILAIGAGEKRAVVRDDQIAIATMMNVTLSCDHRAVDGALGAELLAAFRNYIEKPMGMLA